MIGELDAGNPHVQFDEGVQETCDSATRLCPTLPAPSHQERSSSDYAPPFVDAVLVRQLLGPHLST
jgi:hypothetical protein